MCNRLDCSIRATLLNHWPKTQLKSTGLCWTSFWLVVFWWMFVCTLPYLTGKGCNYTPVCFPPAFLKGGSNHWNRALTYINHIVDPQNANAFFLCVWKSVLVCGSLQFLWEIEYIFGVGWFWKNKKKNLTPNGVFTSWFKSHNVGSDIQHVLLTQSSCIGLEIWIFTIKAECFTALFTLFYLPASWRDLHTHTILSVWLG